MTLFAITFGAPAFLWGMGFASVPIVIHLLHRQRFRQMEWAAMHWLLEAIRKNYRRIRLEQWLLLALRTLLLLLVALAITKPTLDTSDTYLLPDTSVTHLVLVFDNSMSMHYAAGNRSRWERAKTTAQAILDDARKGDVASVVVMGAQATTFRASPYLAEISKEIDSLKPQHGVARLEPALDRVNEILTNSRAARKRVYFITDSQRSLWNNGEDGEPTKELRDKLRATSSQAEITVLDVSDPESPNLAITRLEQREPLIVKGRATMVRAAIANYSNRERADTRVELVVDGQVEATERVNLGPNDEQEVNFRVTFREPGERILEARLAEDGLSLDNHRWLVAKARDALNVLLVDGEPRGEPFKSETDYLQVALVPSEKQTPLYRPEKRLEAELLESPLDHWDSICLCNVGQLTTSEATALREYVRRGGGLLLFLGTQTNQTIYNQLLYAEGKGLMPAKLVGVVGEAKRTDKPFAFSALEYAHPLVRDFKQKERAGLVTTKIFRYVRAELPLRSEAEIALAFDTGDPAIILSNHEQGRVGLVTLSADLDWSTWPALPSYLPIVQQLIEQVVSGRVRSVPTLATEPIHRPLPQRGIDVTATVTTPDSDAGPLSARTETQQGVNYIQFAATDLTGIYRVNVSAPVNESWALAVNTWPEESNLAKSRREDLNTAFPGWKFTYLTEWQGNPQMPVLIQNKGELHRLLLYAALAILLLETLLAWKFGHHTLAAAPLR